MLSALVGRLRGSDQASGRIRRCMVSKLAIRPFPPSRRSFHRALFRSSRARGSTSVARSMASGPWLLKKSMVPGSTGIRVRWTSHGIGSKRPWLGSKYSLRLSEPNRT